MVDILEKEANVRFRSVVGSNASGDLSMRGFGENSQTRVLIMVDGQKFNRPDMGAINWLQIPLSDIESVEVLRGPMSALYGAAAEAGVIKIKTRRPVRRRIFVLRAGDLRIVFHIQPRRARGRQRGRLVFQRGRKLL